MRTDEYKKTAEACKNVWNNLPESDKKNIRSFYKNLKRMPTPENINHHFEMANRLQCLVIEFEAFGMIQTAYDPTFKHNTELELRKIIPSAVVRSSSVELVELHKIDKHHIQYLIDWNEKISKLK
jgi:hypothetical protein